jgi:hypothetical protein
MTDVLEYIFGVVIFPALVASLIALVVALFAVPVWPFRSRASETEGLVGFALMLACVMSFAQDLGWNAIIRQFMTIQGDDTPIEKWHRLGAMAAIIALGAPLLAFVRERAPKRWGRELSIGVSLKTAFLLATLVSFPGSSLGWAIAQGCLAVAATAAFSLGARDVSMWSAWITFAVLSAMAMLGGFASLAVLCGAVSAGAFGIATVYGILPRLKSGVEPLPVGGAIGLALGLLATAVAHCGRAYDTTGTPPWMWMVAPILPAGALLLGHWAAKAKTPARAKLWRVAGVAFFAGVLLVVLALSQGGKESSGGPSDDELKQMYGG